MYIFCPRSYFPYANGVLSNIVLDQTNKHGYILPKVLLFLCPTFPINTLMHRGYDFLFGKFALHNVRNLLYSLNFFLQSVHRVGGAFTLYALNAWFCIKWRGLWCPLTKKRRRENIGKDPYIVQNQQLLNDGAFGGGSRLLVLNQFISHLDLALIHTQEFTIDSVCQRKNVWFR